MDIPYQDFGIALLIGALVGIDRERKKASEDGGPGPGLRTFILLAEAGALAAWLSVQLQWNALFAFSALGVAAVLVAGYLSYAKLHPEAHGLTSEVAGLVVFLLGGTVLFGYRGVAVALAVATSAVLAYKHPLHWLVARLSQDDIYAGVKLLAATFIVLPLLPNQTIDPWDAFNPYKIWLLVILISGLSLVGYVASRWLGPRQGTTLTGLFGGIVSSTVVTLEFARRSREPRQSVRMLDALACGLLLAWTVMFVRIPIVAAFINPEVVQAIALPMAAMGLVAGAWAGYFFLRSCRRPSEKIPEHVSLENPFSLRSAAKFAAIFAVVLFLVKIVETYFEGAAIYLVAVLAGVPDADAITLSMAEFALQGELRSAAVAITLAAMSNTVVKCGLILALGDRRLRWGVVLATVSVLAAGAAALCVPTQMIFS